MTEKWRVWERDEIGREYGELLYRRATGELREMESSKAAARRMRALTRPDDTILDVGCAAGHYLRSLKNQIEWEFIYTGLDATQAYIDLARKAFAHDETSTFRTGDIFDMPFADESFDVVMCNNVLLHLPSIEKPVVELCRVARRAVLLRTLVGRRSFRIMEVRATGDEFEEDGDPKSFNYLNIYSRDYVDHVLSKIAGVRWQIFEDKDFDEAPIQARREDNPNLTNVTTVLDGMQVNEYVMLPWCFVEIRK